MNKISNPSKTVRWFSPNSDYCKFLRGDNSVCDINAATHCAILLMIVNEHNFKQHKNSFNYTVNKVLVKDKAKLHVSILLIIMLMP